MGDQVDVTGDLLDYVRRVSLRDDEILSDLRAETMTLPGGRANSGEMCRIQNPGAVAQSFEQDSKHHHTT